MLQKMVCYVDDDADDLEFIVDGFRPYPDVEVKTFSDGRHFLSFMKALSLDAVLPCLVLLDINIPVINGKEILLRLREDQRFNDVPVIFFTTSSYSFDMDFAQQHGAGFFVKPLNLNQMSGIIETFLSYCQQKIKAGQY